MQVREEGSLAPGSADESGHHFISSARLIAGLTMVSRVFGLVRDIVCAYFFSTAVWHYFAIAFMVPNLFRRLFGEGALSAALIPVYSQQLHSDRKAARALVHSVITLLIMILMALILLGEAFIYFYWRFTSHSPKTFLVLALTAIMLPYLLLICLAAALGGLLNVHRHFASPAALPILLNLCIIISIIYFRKFFGDDPWRQIYVVALAVLIAGFLQLLLQYPDLRRAGISLRFRFDFADKSLRQIFRLMAPMILGLSAMQINALCDYLIAYFLSGSQAGAGFTLWGYTIRYPVVEGSVSFLYYSQRLYQLPLGVFGVALATAVFPLLSLHAALKDHLSFSRILAQGLRLTIFVAFPATLGLILIRVPVVSLILERGAFTHHDTLQVAWTLLFYALGITAYCIQLLVVRAYYSFQDSITPVKIAVRMILLNLFLNLVLIWPLGTGGLALSTALCATIQVVILLRLLINRYQLRLGDGLAGLCRKTCLACAIMVLGGYLTLEAFSAYRSSLQVFAVVTISSLLFVGASWLLKNEELYSLLRRNK